MKACDKSSLYFQILQIIIIQWITLSLTKYLLLHVISAVMSVSLSVQSDMPLACQQLYYFCQVLNTKYCLRSCNFISNPHLHFLAPLGQLPNSLGEPCVIADKLMLIDSEIYEMVASQFSSVISHFIGLGQYISEKRRFLYVC